jgi:hypothetical protein
MRAAAALLAFLSATPVMAADEHGHDHGAPAAPGGPALPRFSAVSEAFELVGVVSGRQLTVYLDRFDDNAPVKDARIELEIGGAKLALEQHAEGEYEGTLAEALQPGVIAITATVVAGNHTDILAGDLDLHAAEDAHGESAPGWRAYAAWAIAVFAALGAWAWTRRRAGRAQPIRVGGPA